ncbi:MAG TPA: nitronate monooxygenase [Acidimicrobiia bacterium]|nr:nitronate monooxygenase [Acidimicrobiia bacterium]
MLKTWLTDRFDLDLPLISAPMGGAANGRFATEVCRHGALGMVAAGTRATAEQVHRETADLVATEEAWGVGLLAWVVERRPELIEAVESLAPPLVSVSYGDYASHVSRLHDVGSTVTTQVNSLDEAQKAAAAGVDFLVARGGEGGGHGRNEMATLPLLQELLDNIDLPVVAAGGIGSARGLAAVLAAGAVGAWVGTAFLGCDEIAWPDGSKKRVVSAGDGDTIYTGSFDVGLGLDWPIGFGGRALANDYSDRWHGREDELADSESPPEGDDAPIWAGQAVSLVTELRSVSAVLAEFRRAESLLRRWC